MSDADFYQRYDDLTYWRTKLFSEYNEEEDESLIEDSEVDLIYENDVEVIEDYKQDNLQTIIRTKTSKLPKRKKNPFINDEAEMAFDVDDCFYDDIECTQKELNDSMEDFISDETFSQIDNDKREYFQSISNMVGIPEHQKYKLKFDYDPDVNVYSQAVVHDDEDEYEMDSFCCDDIIYATDDEDKRKKSISPDMKLRSKKRINRILDETPEKQNERKDKRYKRIVIESP